jgi:AcrR family transcriptional regulator
MYRELVFESAEHVFAEKGFDDAAMQEVAGEAGISLKTLYATYPGKSDLYREIQETRGRELVEAIEKAIRGRDDPRAMLEAGVRGYVDFLVAHPNYLRIHLRERAAWGLAPSGAYALEQWQQGVALHAEILRRGIERGVFYDGDPELLARRGIALMQVELGRYAESPEKIDAEALAGEIVLQLRRLLCKPGPGGGPAPSAGRRERR